jgi:hypothetical protein
VFSVPWPGVPAHDDVSPRAAGKTQARPIAPHADADGTPDGCDHCAGFDDNADADSDGTPDGCDLCVGSDDNADADSDGVPDDCDPAPTSTTPWTAMRTVSPTPAMSAPRTQAMTMTVTASELIHDGEVLVALLPGQLIDADGANAIEAAMRQAPADGRLDRAKHRVMFRKSIWSAVQECPRPRGSRSCGIFDHGALPRSLDTLRRCGALHTR